MGRHKEWRKIAKKFRRKRVRSAKAQERDLILQKEQEEREKLPGYAAWLSEQTALELFHQEERERQRIEAQKKWEEEEKEAQIRWQEQQKKIADAKVEKARQEALIREEWDREEKKKKANEEKKKKEEEEKERRQAEFLEQIDAYINGTGTLPEGAVVGSETHPSELECPFFSKVGACRFWDFCSREFYDDVVSELKTYGKLVQFKVCCNAEPHLRGNVYAQYSDKRAALKAYRALQGRFYSQKQIKVEFTKIPSWQSAICGLFQGKRCPKGKNCNFLHVFRNPTSEFRNADKDIFPHRRKPKRSSERKHWRWSESPEPVSIPTVAKPSKRERGDKENKLHETERRRSEKTRRRSTQKSKEEREDKSEQHFSDAESECDTSSRSSEDRNYYRQSHRKRKRHKRSISSDYLDHDSKQPRDERSVSSASGEKQSEKSVKDAKKKKSRKSISSDKESFEKKGKGSKNKMLKEEK